MGQNRNCFSRAGSCACLWSEGGQGRHQGLPDDSAGIRHETPPVRGKTKEIIKVSEEIRRNYGNINIKKG